jgi:predicted DNA-binding transcriptional regulator AlpA
MTAGKKPEKPKYNFINNDTIHDDIINAVNSIVLSMGYDIKNPKERKQITHNELNYIFRQVYILLFKPDKPLYNNQNSKINYDDITQLKIISESFLDICTSFNKSLGLMSFCYFTGISQDTIYKWISPEGEKLNRARSEIIKYIKDGHKAAQIALLNDSPVGALAVANNDIDTGLEWSRNNALQAASNTVFLLSSERAEKLRLTAPETAENMT